MFLVLLIFFVFVERLGHKDYQISVQIFAICHEIAINDF
jgi:hypothetical protein